MSTTLARLVVASLLVVPLLHAAASASASANAEDALAVRTVVGNPGKEGPALQVAMNPYALALRGDRVLIADAANSVIRSLDLGSGAVTTVAGLGGGQYPADLGDGAPARGVQIGTPVSLAVAPDGSFVFGDSGFGGSRARRVALDGTVHVLAGNGDQSFSGDGGPATEAGLYGQGGVAVAADGSVWISDTYSNRVRRVAPDGTIQTAVGAGAKGFGGDGGLATEALLDEPKGLAFTPDGDLLVADSGNNRIRRVTPDGVITTVAGSGPSGGSTFGDGRGSQGDGGPATSALLHAPSAARPTSDGGFLIADTLNHKIRRVSQDGTISTVAGGGERHYGRDGVPALDTNLFAPEDVLPLPDSRIVIADTRAGRVRVVGSDGIIRAVAGNYAMVYSGDGGPGVDAQSGVTRRVALAPDGDLYFGDYEHGWVVRRLEATDGTVHPVAGYAQSRQAPADGASALTAYLTQVSALALDADGGLLIAEGTLIRRVDLSTGRQQVWAGATAAGDAGDGGHRTTALFSRLSALRVLPSGDVLVVDPGAQRVRRISPDGLVTAVAGTGVRGFSGDGGAATRAQLNEPADAVAGADGTIFIADEQNERIRAVGADGTIRTVAGSGAHGFSDKRIPGPALEAGIRPGSLAVLPDGRILLTDLFAYSIYSFDPRDSTVRRFAGTGRSGFADGGTGTAMFSFVEGLAVDPVRRVVYAGDPGNQRVRAVGFTDTSTSSPTPGASTHPAPPPPPPPPPSPSASASPTAEPTAPGATAPSDPPASSPTPTTSHVVPSVSVSPFVVRFGQPAYVTISGTPGAEVDLFIRKYRGDFIKIRDGLVLDQSGQTTVVTRPDMNLRFLAKDRTLEEGSSIGGTSGLMTVEKQVSINVSRVGPHRFTFSGSVNPMHPGATVHLYRNGTLHKANIPVSRSRAYSLTVTLPPGSANYRITSSTTGYNNVSHSPTRSVRVY